MSLRPTIKLTCDRQLWTISHDDWVIPIHFAPCLTPAGKEGEYVATAIPPTGPQYEALVAFLKPHILTDLGSFWVLHPGSVAQIATQAPGITPSLYMKWGGKFTHRDQEVFVPTEVVPDGDKVEYKPAKEPEQFLRRIAESGLATLPVVKALWAVIQTEAVRQLYTKKKPLDLGFAKLVAVPYRASWKAHILSENPELITIMRLPRYERMAAFAKTDLGARLRSSDLLEFDPEEGLIGWNIECIVSKNWDDWIATQEKRQRAVTGPVGYARRWSAIINKISKDIYDTLEAWADKCSRPFAAVDSGGMFGGVAFVRAVDRKRVRSADIIQPKLDCRYSDPVDTLYSPEQGEDATPQPQIGGVSEVPNLLQPTPDVWPSGSGLDQRNRGEGADGLHLLSSPSDVSPNEKVLGESE